MSETQRNDSVSDKRECAGSTWKRFFFESNQFFDHIENMGDWRRLKTAYPSMTNDELLDAKEATYGGHRKQSVRDERPNYGFRHEHDGERTLRDFFKANGMKLDESNEKISGRKGGKTGE